MTHYSQNTIVTIDGPAGAGKSTVARKVADLLGWMYLDTGAMYRAVTWKAIQENVDLTDSDILADLAAKSSFEMIASDDGYKILLDGQDVSLPIRSTDVTNKTFHIAGSTSVREVLVGWQRQIGTHQDIVVEGRDIGSVVFPEAQFKFYLDAIPEERARRRWLELKAQGQDSDLELLTCQIQERDERDRARPVSPLILPHDAHVIDSSYLSCDQVVEHIIKVVKTDG